MSGRAEGKGGTAQPPAGSADFASGAVQRRAPAFVHALAACDGHDGARLIGKSARANRSRVRQPACGRRAWLAVPLHEIQVSAPRSRLCNRVRCKVTATCLQQVPRTNRAACRWPTVRVEVFTSGQSALRCEAHLFPASNNEGHWSSSHGFIEVHGRRKKLMSHSEASNVAGDFAAPRSVQSGNWMAKHPVVLKHSF